MFLNGLFLCPKIEFGYPRLWPSMVQRNLDRSGDRPLIFVSFNVRKNKYRQAVQIASSIYLPTA